MQRLFDQTVYGRCNCPAFGGATGAVTSTGQPAVGTGLFGGTSTGSYTVCFSFQIYVMQKRHQLGLFVVCIQCSY